MNKNYGLSLKTPDEEIFKTGLFSCFEYCRADFRIPGSFELTQSDVPRLIELSDKYNIAIRSYHIPFNDEGPVPFIPASLIREERELTLENTKKLITILKDCGIKIVVIHGSLRVLPEERQQRLDNFVGYVQKLCDFCKPLGISVAVETLKPRCIGNGLTEHLYIMEHVNRDNVGICFDSNHLLDEDNIAFLEGAGQYVLTTHFSDYDGIDEKHWFPGRGINDWKKIVEVLERKGYNGPYVFEVSFPGGVATADECRTLVNEWEKIFS